MNQSAPEPVRIVPLTTYQGYEWRGALSPDGRQVAFDWTRKPGDTRVYVKLVRTGDPVRLTSGSAVEFNPVWSPDGQQIAFLRLEAPGRIGVYLSPSLGGTEQKLTDFRVSWDMNLNVPFYSSLLTWSPDGRRLIAVAEEGDRWAATGLLQVSTDTGEAKWLRHPPEAAGTGDTQPAFSPDGRSVAFVQKSSAFAGDVYVAPFGASGSFGEPRRLTKDWGPVIGGIAWMPDGRSLLFTSNRMVRRLHRVSAVSPAEPAPLSAPGAALQPHVSPGGKLVFSVSTGDRNIWRRGIPHPGQNIRPPEQLIASTARDSNPQYSPDGSRIAFQSTRSGTFQIWTCDSDGSRCTQVTRDFPETHVGTPRWSPDGGSIVFDASPSGNFDLYVANAAGGTARQLTDHPSDDACASFSHDGRNIYFYSLRSGKSQVWKIPFRGGTAVQVTDEEGWCAFESPDGKYLFYSRGNEGPGLQSIWRRSLTDSGKDVLVVKRFYAAARAWALGAGRLWYITPGGAGAQLRSIDFEARSDKLHDELPTPTDMGLSVSPDGRFVIYSQIDNPGSDLRLIENVR